MAESLVSGRTARSIVHSGRWIAAFTLYAATVSTGFAALYLSRAYRAEGQYLGFGRALLWQAAIYLSWAALVPLIAWLVRRYPLGTRKWRRSLVAHLAAYAGLVAAHALLAAWATWALRPIGPAGRAAAGDAMFALWIERLPVDILIYLAIAGALFAVEHWRQLRRREHAAAVMEAELARAQLHALRAQLQPHFLFNALQTITSLIRTDSDSARRMTVRLGDLLRASLERSGAPTVSLRDEIVLLQHYLEIEAIRFRDRLLVSYDFPPETLDCLVPDLVLQPLAENAVKHGIAPRSRGGHIAVSARLVDGRLLLTVADDGVGLHGGMNGDTCGSTREGASRGLAITRERVEKLFDGTGTLTLVPGADGAGVIARIELPAVRCDVAAAT